MTLRVGMVELVARVRFMTDTGVDPTDYGNFFLDDYIQEELDRTAVEYSRVPLVPVPTLLPTNTLSYLDFIWLDEMGRDLERPTADYYDTSFRVQTVTGEQRFMGAGANDYSVDWSTPKLIFNSTQSEHSFVLSAKKFNLNLAAANIWLIKANRRVELIQWRTDNHTMYQDQEYLHCKERYEYYMGIGGKSFSRFMRVDEKRGNPYARSYKRY